MLRKDPDSRFTAEQVLASPWIDKSKKSSGISDPELGKQIIGNLKNFHVLCLKFSSRTSWKLSFTPTLPPSSTPIKTKSYCSKLLKRLIGTGTGSSNETSLWAFLMIQTPPYSLRKWSASSRSLTPMAQDASISLSSLWLPATNSSYWKGSSWKAHSATLILTTQASSPLRRYRPS